MCVDRTPSTEMWVVSLDSDFAFSRSTCSYLCKPFYTPPPISPIYIQEVGGGVILESLCLPVRLFVRLSVCSSVCVSNHVHSVSSKLLNHFLPNLVCWCIIMRRCVMCNNLFTIFSVKVTVRAYIIKIWLFLLHFLNCRSICKQTWFDSTAS